MHQKAVCVHAAQVGAAEWMPAQNYYFPLEGAAQAAVEEVWARLLAEDGAQEAAVTLPVIYGRSLEVCLASARSPCWCAQAFQTVLITNVPDFSLQVGLT